MVAHHFLNTLTVSIIIFQIRSEPGILSSLYCVSLLPGFKSLHINLYVGESYAQVSLCC